MDCEQKQPPEVCSLHFPIFADKQKSKYYNQNIAWVFLC